MFKGLSLEPLRSLTERVRKPGIIALVSKLIKQKEIIELLGIKTDKEYLTSDSKYFIGGSVYIFMLKLNAKGI